ncbi:MAG: MCP four helix bundle domain-containing protein, partial [Steroidobacter sp.]
MLGNLKVGTRLGVGFGLVVALLAITAFVSIQRLGALDHSVSVIMEDKYPKAMLAMELRRDISAMRIVLRDMVIDSSPTELRAARERLDTVQTATRKVSDELTRVVATDEGKTRLAAVLDAARGYFGAQGQFVDLVAAGRREAALELMHGEMFRDQKAYDDAVEALVKYEEEEMKAANTRAEQVHGGGRMLVLIFSALAAVLAFVAALWVTRSVTRPLAVAGDAANRIASGDLTGEITATSEDETGQLLTTLSKMQTQLRDRIESDARSAAESLRLRQALDNVGANVMVADNDLNIIYLNRTLESMLKNAESDIRKDLPRFDVSRLIGTNIDIFHKNPAHQRGLLAGLSKTFTSTLKVGGRSLRIIANPVNDAAGKRIGTVVE